MCGESEFRLVGRVFPTRRHHQVEIYASNIISYLEYSPEILGLVTLTISSQSAVLLGLCRKVKDVNSV